jgi:two-component system, NtrC family, response regulator AtoC
MLRKIFYRGIHFIKFGFSFFRSGEPYVSDKTILLINGDLNFCRLHGDELENQGFKVVFAHTLELATLKLNAYNPNIILLDQKLPDGSGIGFLEKNILALEHKPVILMTADESAASGNISMKPRVFEILSKPFQPSALNKLVYMAAHFSGIS